MSASRNTHLESAFCQRGLSARVCLSSHVWRTIHLKYALSMEHHNNCDTDAASCKKILHHRQLWLIYEMRLAYFSYSVRAQAWSLVKVMPSSGRFKASRFSASLLSSLSTLIKLSKV